MLAHTITWNGHGRGSYPSVAVFPVEDVGEEFEENYKRQRQRSGKSLSLLNVLLHSVLETDRKNERQCRLLY
jgi:hypothetical protein